MLSSLFKVAGDGREMKRGGSHVQPWVHSKLSKQGMGRMSLDDHPFEWTQTKSGKLMIYRGGELVMIVSPAKAAPILAKLGLDSDTDQQVLARVTGQYRIGNERMGKSKRK